MKLLMEKYKKEIIPEMKKRFGYSSVMAVPHLTKIVVHSGVGRITRDKGSDEEVITYLSIITGQKPVPCAAHKSIASFKTRQGQILGHKVTLRGARMYHFLDRLLSAAIPRMRDFRGLEPGIVVGKTLTMGIREHIIFPETIGADVRTLFGMEVTAASNAQTQKEAYALFQLLGFPFKKE